MKKDPHAMVEALYLFACGSELGGAHYAVRSLSDGFDWHILLINLKVGPPESPNGLAWDGTLLAHLRVAIAKYQILKSTPRPFTSCRLHMRISRRAASGASELQFGGCPVGANDRVARKAITLVSCPRPPLKLSTMTGPRMMADVHGLICMKGLMMNSLPVGCEGWWASQSRL